MGRENVELIVGLDIGTTKICAVVGAVSDDGVEIVGVGMHPSVGLRKGVVVNIENTVKSIRKAIEEAEMMASCDVSVVYVGIAGSHVKGFNSHGLIAINQREIKEEDIERVIEAARAVSIPPDLEVIHVLPQEYVVDDHAGIQNPRGMTGVRLEADVHIVTCSASAVHNIVKCCNMAGLQVASVVLEPIASADAVLSPEEMDLGVALLDIGGGTSDLAIFSEGAIRHTFVLGVGGNNLTNDLSIGLRTPMKEAERLKEEYGCALSSMIERDQAIEVPSVGERPPRRMSRKIMGDIIEPRVEEMLTLINQEMEEIAHNDTTYKGLATAGLVITGGTALLENLYEMAEQIFDLPVRIGVPQGIGGVSDIVNTPQCSTGVGLVVYGMNNKVVSYNQKSEKIFGKLSSQIKGIFGRFL